MLSAIKVLLANCLLCYARETNEELHRKRNIYKETFVCEDECEFEFVLRHRFTMSCPANDGNWYSIEIEGGENDPSSARIVPATNTHSPFPEHLEGKNLQFNEKDCIFGDGSKSNKITINDQFPGPTLELREGAKIHIKVRNLLSSIAPTIHWHGLELRGGYYWYDGALGITQCGIDPNQEFTYSFTAEHAGTFWYHGHSGTIKMDGLFGAIIVHPKSNVKSTEGLNHKISESAQSNVLVFAEMVHSAIHNGGSEAFLSSSFYLGGSGESTTNKTINRTYLPSGVHSTAYIFDSLGMNGRARIPGKALVPFQNFQHLEGGLLYLVCATADWSVYFTIEGHKLEVVALDGFEIEPIVVDKLMLSPGETAEVRPILSNNMEGASFLMEVIEVATVIGQDSHAKPLERRSSHAYLVYQNEQRGQPLDGDTEVTVGNVPWTKTAQGESHITVDKIYGTKSPTPNGYFPSADDEKSGKFYKMMINLHLAGSPSFNGFGYKYPPVPYSTQGEQEVKKCPEYCLHPDGPFTPECTCNNAYDIPLGSIVEITITSLAHTLSYHFYHPVHIHGNAFFVMAYGNGTETGPEPEPIQNNNKFECDPLAPLCSKAIQVADDIEFNYKNPPKRTTVMVPAGGFAIIRFRADNPGIWLMHCHVMSHLMKGQSLSLNVINEGIPPVPGHFPTCPLHKSSDFVEDLPLVSLSSINSQEVTSDSSAAKRTEHISFIILFSLSLYHLTRHFY